MKNGVSTIDFETTSIEARPDFPPTPVGVAIRLPGRKQRYYAFGHPSENSCSKEDAARALREAVKHPVLMHNSKFDLDVLEEAFGITPKCGFHDTMFLAFLFNPHAPSHSLKPFAESVLGIKPDERDAVRSWLFEFVPEARRKKKNWGAYISRAPGKLVGQYSIGDIDRTEKLYDFLLPKITEAGMLPAYERELALTPILLANEREGIRIDATRLVKDRRLAEHDLETTDRWIRAELRAKPDLNIDSNDDLADALEYAGKVKKWIATATGQRSTSKENMLEVLEDRALAFALMYRAKIAYSISSFMRPWLDQADRTGGRIHTQWNQVKGRNEQGGFGAKTGRLSSSPNLQNVTRKPIPLVVYGKPADGVAGYHYLPLPASLLRRLKLRDPDGRPMLPHLRSYILPDKGGMLIDSDFSGQEMRILAHFEQGPLMREYIAEPRLDVHNRIRDMIKAKTGVELQRTAVKAISFSSLYGAGIAKLAKQLGCDEKAAKQLKDAYHAALPGIKVLDMKNKVEGAVTTWGGRYVKAEEGVVDADGNPRDLRWRPRWWRTIVQRKMDACF